MNTDIVLIEPTKYTWGKLGLFGRHSRLEPLGIEYIGAICKKNGYKVKIIQQRNETVEKLCEMCLKYNPKWVGISSLTHTWDFVKKISQILKKRDPCLKIIVGGYHSSLNPKMCLEPETIDFVVIGEGETTFTELVQTLNGGERIDKIKGIAYKEDAQIRITPPRERISCIDHLPFPLRDKSILENCKVGGALYPPPPKQVNVAQILYSRGCSFNCSYCCSSPLWGKLVYYRSPENVIKEIKFLQQRFNTNLLFFADLTFNLNKRKLIHLCEEIKNNKINISWWCMCRIDNIDKELLLKMKEAGCCKIGFGIESLIGQIQKNINKYQATPLSLIYEVLNFTWSIGISTRAFLMIGNPGEKIEDIIYTRDIIKQLPIDELRIGIFTPFPGLKVFKDLRKRKLLLTEDWSRYTTEENVIKRNGMLHHTLEELRDEILKDFYESDSYKKHVEEKTNKYPYLKQSYEWFFSFLLDKGIRI